MGRVVGGGQGVSADPGGVDHWFEPLADHMGAAYLRYSFTKGTVNEVDHLMSVLGLSAGSRVLDVGCGPGRHLLEFARRGVVVHGVDISQTFVDLAAASIAAENLESATVERADARELAQMEHLRGSFDAVVALCQGGFGLMTVADARDGVDGDRCVLAGMVSALRPRGRVALTAFSSLFVVDSVARGTFPDASFDPAAGVCHERTEVRDTAGVAMQADLWTSCYTPRELRLLCDLEGLEVESLSGVEPGHYATRTPALEHPEWLLVARRM